MPLEEEDVGGNAMTIAARMMRFLVFIVPFLFVEFPEFGFIDCATCICSAPRMRRREFENSEFIKSLVSAAVRHTRIPATIAAPGMPTSTSSTRLRICCWDRKRLTCSTSRGGIPTRSSRAVEPVEGVARQGPRCRRWRCRGRSGSRSRQRPPGGIRWPPPLRHRLPPRASSTATPTTAGPGLSASSKATGSPRSSMPRSVSPQPSSEVWTSDRRAIARLPPATGTR